VTIVVSPPAREDLKRAYQQIKQDNPKAADRVLARIIEVIGLLASGSVEGREVRLRDGRRVHSWPVPPYRVYYRKSADVCEVEVREHLSFHPGELKAAPEIAGRRGPQVGTYGDAKRFHGALQCRLAPRDLWQIRGMS
jgi:plasmid stabilization system protein ParE